MVRVHTLPEHYVQILLHLKECKSLSYDSEVAEQAVGSGDVLCLGMLNALVHFGVDGKSGEELSDGHFVSVLLQCAQSFLFLL
jgi:hypothetical protein